MNNNDKELHEELERGLKARHIQLIGLGGAIGVGLFLGSATAIELAGPSVLLTYIIGGIAIYFIMRALGELFHRVSRVRRIQRSCGPFPRAEMGLPHRMDLLVHVDGHLHGGAHRHWDLHEFLVS